MIVAALLHGCAGSRPATRDQTDQAVNIQAQWLTSLQVGQSPATVLEPILPYQKHSFELHEGGTLYQYVEGRFPRTNLLFGVYFENQQLVSLLLNQQVTDFARCWVSARYDSAEKSWSLERQISPFVSWLRGQNELNGDYDPQASYPWPEGHDSMSAAEMAEAATYLPMIAVFLPIYVVDRIAGGAQRDKKAAGDKLHYQRVAAGLALGESSDNLLTSMGSPDRKQNEGSLDVWTYQRSGILFGIVDKAIAWKETVFTGIPQNAVTSLDQLNCNAMMEVARHADP